MLFSILLSTFFLFIECISSYKIEPYLYGTWMLRYTDDEKLIPIQSYLIIKDNTNIKLRTVRMNWIFATKISKTGKIQNIRYNYFQRKIDIDVQFNQVNKYSYSILGIEIPEFRYEQIKEYKLSKKLSIQEYEKILYMIDKDTKYSYIFDLLLYNTKLPYIEMSIYTFIFSQFFGVFINLLILYLIK